MSSKSTIWSRAGWEPWRKTAIQTEVSTRTTASGPIHAAVLADDREIAFPEARARQTAHAPSLGSTYEPLQRPFHRPGIRPFAAQSGRLLEQVCIEHKICTFHTHQ